MDTATVRIEHDIVYLYGTFHQGDELQFIDYSRGHQCVTNSVSAIALSKIYPIREWTTQHLDGILKAGDILYQQIRPVEFFNQQPLDNGLLELDDIPVECDIFNRQFEIQNIGSMYCGINVTEIGDCLYDMCQHPLDCDAIVVMGDQYGAYASSLMQHNEKLYIFDPHSISHITGMPCADGRSVLLAFNNISKCAEYLVRCANSRQAIQLSIWKLMITGIQQYQCRDKAFKFQIETPQISSTHSITFSKEEHKSINMKSHTSIPEKRTHHSKISDNKRTHSEIITDFEEINNEKKSSPICKTYLKQLDSLCNYNSHEEKSKNKQETIITYKCSRIFDNWKNLPSHKKTCEKQHKDVKKLNDRIKRDHKKSARAMQLKSKYITITSEENIVTDKLKHINYKIKDRQYQILKLQKQIDAHEKKNNSEKNYAYLRTQVSSLQEQIVKLETLVQDLTDKKNELHQQKRSFGNNLQLFGNETSGNETFKLETAKLPNVVRSHQTEHQKLRKRPFLELITEASKSSQPNKDVNTELPAKQSRHSKYQIDEFDNDTYDKYRKFMKREYMKQKRMSTDYRQKENLKQKEYQAQRHSSTKFRQKENLKKREYQAQRRSSTKFRQKENLKQRMHQAQRRSLTELRQKENVKQREYQAQRRSSTELRQKENAKQREYEVQRCSSTEFRQKENLKQREYQTQRRSSTEFRQKENLKQREYEAQRRLSTEFRQKENVKQREYQTQRRSSTELRQKENLKQREYQAQRHLSTELRQKENLKQREYQAQRRSSTEKRQKENVKKREHMTEKLKSSEFKDNENERNKCHKAQKHTSEEFRGEESAHKQARTQVNIYGNNLSESIRIFLDSVSQGPIYVCSSCLQTHFADNVLKVSSLHPGKHQLLLEECLTQYKSIDEEEWLCLSCKREIYNGLVPKLSQINKVGFPEKPQELDLNRLEEFFIHLSQHS